MAVVTLLTCGAGILEDDTAEPAWSVSARHAAGRRDIVEYDDRWSAEQATRGQGELRRYVASLQFSPDSRLTVALHLGAASAEATDFPPSSYLQSYGAGPAVGMGVRAVVGRIPEWDVEFDALFDYLFARPGDASVPVAGHVERFSADVEEWQAGLEARKSWDPWTAIVGLRYSDLEINYRHHGTREGGFEADGNIGLALGGTCELIEGISATVLLHLVDETGIEIGVEYRF
jgi:hypothetical protein